MNKKKVKRKVAKPHSYYPAKTERELTLVLNENLLEAWTKIKELSQTWGEQRVYTSAKAMMFSRKRCYMFMRPKKSHVELSFFLTEKLSDAMIKRTQAVSKTKFAHIDQIIHADQIEEPLSQWLEQAYQESN